MVSRLGDKLLRYCVGNQRLFIVAPYIKANALVRILDAVDSITSLTCVTKWQPHDIAAGVSDTECRTIVKEHGGAFWLHPSLHAKYYRLNDDVLIGSANLTLAGMGWAAQPNLEILTLAGKDFDPDAFERELLKDARQISDEEFRNWETIARATTKKYTPADGEQSLLQTWRPSTRDPRNLELAYGGKLEEIASFDEQRSAARDIQDMQIPQGLSAEQFHAWSLTCLLTSSFTNAVIGFQDTDIQAAARTLAKAYGLSVTEARRDIETVQNWLAFFLPNPPHHRRDSSAYTWSGSR